MHEYIEVYGQILESDICVTHKAASKVTERNLRIFEKCQAKGIPLTLRDLYYYGNELFEHQLYNRAIEIYQKFLNTGQGWVYNKIYGVPCLRLARRGYHIYRCVFAMIA